MNFLNPQRAQDILGRAGYLPNDTLNDMIKEKYGITTEAEYRRFLQKNPEIFNQMFKVKDLYKNNE